MTDTGNCARKTSGTQGIATAPHSPLIWWRYIDDIFLLWTHGEDKLNGFITYLNNLHPTIKFTSSFPFNEIPFLDVIFQKRVRVFHRGFQTREN